MDIWQYQPLDHQLLTPKDQAYIHFQLTYRTHWSDYHKQESNFTLRPQHLPLQEKRWRKYQLHFQNTNKIRSEQEWKHRFWLFQVHSKDYHLRLFHKRTWIHHHLLCSYIRKPCRLCLQPNMIYNLKDWLTWWLEGLTLLWSAHRIDYPY